MRVTKGAVIAGAAFVIACGLLFWQLTGVPIGGPERHVDSPPGATPVTERPPASPQSAVASNLSAEAASAAAINAYIVQGPGNTGFTQADAEWLLEVVRTHPDETARRRALTGMGWALSGVEGGFPAPGFDEATGRAMEEAVMRAVGDSSMNVRRSAVSAALNVPGLRGSAEVLAELRKLAEDPDERTAVWARGKVQELAGAP